MGGGVSKITNVGGSSDKMVRPELPAGHFARDLATGMPLVVEVIKVEGLPSKLSAVFIRLTLSRRDEKTGEVKVLAQEVTNDCYSTCEPVWRVFRALHPEVLQTDIIHVAVVARRKLSSTFVVCSSKCTCVELVLSKGLKMKGPAKKPIHAYFGVVPPMSLQPKKRIFLLRHGESYWNQAQANNDVIGMLKQYDHPLNAVGVEQARAFSRKWKLLGEQDAMDQTISHVKNKSVASSMEESFLVAEEVYSSPLCRAVQTSLVALQGHPVVTEKGIKLLTSIREVQSFGGLDSMCSSYGEESFERAKENLQRVSAEISEETNHIKVDPFNSYSEYWKYREGKADVSKRTRDFLGTVQYGRSPCAIFVGHSKFFQNFFRRVSYDLRHEKVRELAERLQRGKLENCGCVGVDIEFKGHYASNQITNIEAAVSEEQIDWVTVTNIELLFGSNVLTGDKMGNSDGCSLSINDKSTALEQKIPEDETAISRQAPA